MGVYFIWKQMHHAYTYMQASQIIYIWCQRNWL